MRFATGLSAVLIAATLPVSAAPGQVLTHQKISQTEGGFAGTLAIDDLFGISMAALGDVDGHGVGDLAVGARRDNDGATAAGAVWVLLLRPGGTVESTGKISQTAGGFTGPLDEYDLFGGGLAGIGDHDGDGVPDLAVGASGDDDGGDFQGAVWILFLNADGTVKAQQKISATQGGFAGNLDPGDGFGHGLASLGDLDGDGTRDLAVGAIGDDDGGFGSVPDVGAVWILFMNPNGTVKGHQKISATQGGFTGTIADGDLFGLGLASVGDLDGDGVADLAVGAPSPASSSIPVPGAVWILFLRSDGTVRSHTKIGPGAGGFTGAVKDDDRFGIDVASLGDLDGDGVVELAVGADGDDDGVGLDLGAVWVLSLNNDGTVKRQRKISATEGRFTGQLDPGDHFGSAVVGMGELGGECAGDLLAVGGVLDDDGGEDRGAAWMLFLEDSSLVSLDLGEDGLEWCMNANAALILGFDVVFGDLGALQASAGDFSQAVLGCLANNEPDSTLGFTGTPSPGAGLWFLVRHVAVAGPGSYDSGEVSQVGSRDSEIAASGLACP